MARVFVSVKTLMSEQYAVVVARRRMKAFVCRSLHALGNAIDKAPGFIVPLVNVIVNDETARLFTIPISTVSAFARLTECETSLKFDFP